MSLFSGSHKLSGVVYKSWSSGSSSCSLYFLFPSAACVSDVPRVVPSVQSYCAPALLRPNVLQRRSVSLTVRPRPHRVQVTYRAGSCLWSVCCLLSVWCLAPRSTSKQGMGKTERHPAVLGLFRQGGKLVFRDEILTKQFHLSCIRLQAAQQCEWSLILQVFHVFWPCGSWASRLGYGVLVQVRLEAEKNPFAFGGEYLGGRLSH